MYIYNDYCDLNTHTEIIVENDCYYNNCENDQYCEENSVYNNQTCYVGSCNLDSGLCQEIVEDITTKTDECGNGEILEFCDGENIVRTESTRSCVEENNEAFCVGSSSISIIEQCGPDSCTDFTVLDPYTKEYVYDEESCQFNEYP